MMKISCIIETPRDPYGRYAFALLKLGLSVALMGMLCLTLPLYLPASEVNAGLIVVVCLPALLYFPGIMSLLDSFLDGGKEAIGPIKRVVTLLFALAVPVVLVCAALPYFEPDPSTGNYPNVQLPFFMAGSFLALLLAIVDALAYGFSNRQKSLVHGGSPLKNPKREAYWKLPMRDVLYATFMALRVDPRLDIFGFLDGKEVELNGKSGAYLTTLSGALEKLGDGWAADFGKTLQENSRLFGKDPRYVMAVAMGERSLKKASFFAPVPPIALASICVILSASAFSYGNDLPTYVYFLGSLFIGLLFSGWLHFHSVIGAEQALPSFDHYAWIILLAVNLVCFGLYFALPPLGSVILLALLALVDLGLGAYRIYVLSNLGKLVEVPS